MTRALVCFIALLAGGSPLSSQAEPADLAIRKIVLYKHGVGYFEREAAVEGNATVRLAFKAAQMQDVLKSLYAVDLDGGRVPEILYDSKDPIEKQLEDILFEVPEGNALTQLLMQLKGAHVRVAVGARQVEGRVLGIEPVSLQTDKGVVTTHRLVLFEKAGTIVNLELLDAGQIEILDESARQDLSRILEIGAKARHADRKIVALRTEGQGQHRLRVGYIIETPIWKTSYRLLLDGGAPPLLQGWAIVENRTDDDWNGVQLTFVAGSPMSFVLDLYTSYYPSRPVLDPGLGAADSGRPVGEAGGGATVRRGRAQARQPGPGGPSTPGPSGPATPGRALRAPALGELMENSLLPMTQGVEVGDLFAYQAQGKVTIKQGQAALVPILLEKLPDAQRVLYFRRDLSVHPSHAVRLVNSTSLTLEKGPLTVFEGSTCLGEAMLAKTLQTGMHEMLPYALETGVEIGVRRDSRPQPVTRGVLASGVLTLVHGELLETRYEVRNKTAKNHVAYLDHPRAGGDFELVEPPAADETLPAHLRFKTQADAESQTVFTVREERQVSVQVSIANESLDRVRFFSQQPYLSEATRGLLVQLATWLERRNDLEDRQKALEAERAKRIADQENLRQNLGVLQQSPEERKLRDRYLARLTEAMERVDQIDQQLATARQERLAVEASIREALERHRD